MFLKCVAHLFFFKGWVVRPLHMWAPYSDMMWLCDDLG